MKVSSNWMSNMPESVYIHIPFCKSKCKYCSFVSFGQYNIEYFSHLEKEIDTYYKGESLKTLYFGGGTPSLLNIETAKQLINKFKFTPDCEVTFETNPDDAKLDYLKGLRELGINRLSMGAQTFDDNILKQIGRRHCAADTLKAVENAKQAGFENISLDLIYGLGSGLNRIKTDVETLISLDIPHISTYGLKIEEGSYFYTHPPKDLPDEDAQADMYLLINETLEKAGYKRYEVSNFAIPGYESRHNLNYWNNNEYYGFGTSAHGYVDGIRYSNSKEIKYIPHEIEHRVTESEKLEEEIFLGFRKTAGININNINQKFDIDFEEKYKKVLDKYVPNYITKTPCGYKLTTQGVLLSNLILSEFLV